MNSITIAIIVLAFVFGGALGGLLLRSRLPGHHLQEDSKDIVKLAIGVIATMAALVLGLLVSSAKSAFDQTSDELTRASTKVVQLDYVLAQYGDEASEVRGVLRQDFHALVDALVSADRSRLEKLRANGASDGIGKIQTEIRSLSPRTDAQRELRARALTLAEDASTNRLLVLLQQHNSISAPLLIVVVSWLTLIFVGFGLYSPRNGTVIAALFLCALSVSGAIFLILEMDNPLEGVVRISGAPMRSALSMLTHE